jgi:hypothetical protein
MDLDQKAIEFCLEGGETPDFDCAKAMYEDGAHSKSVSAIAISDATGLPADIAQATRLMGMNANGTAVMVFVQGANATTGDMSMNVQYVDEGCYVGANMVPVLTGCLAPTGNLTVDGGNVTFSYSYDPNTTGNVYDIQGFTLSSEFRWVEGGNLTTDFQKFVDFYGAETYADDIIMAALTGTSTDFPTGKNMDMSAVDETGRIGKWIYMLRIMIMSYIQERTSLLRAWNLSVKFYSHTVDFNSLSVSFILFYIPPLHHRGCRQGHGVHGHLDVCHTRARTCHFPV